MNTVYDAFNKAPTTSPLSAKAKRILAEGKSLSSSGHREQAEQLALEALKKVILPVSKDNCG